MGTSRAKAAARTAEEPAIACATPAAWERWLATHHATSTAVWLRIAKKSAGVTSVTYPEALERALAWGWIDGHKKPVDEAWWMQRFSPRRARSPWSKRNREAAETMIAAGTMHHEGLAEVERAKKDGRWEAAYDGARTSTVPDDLAQALRANREAAAFFEALDGANRYAILYRVQTAKKAETRAARIAAFVEMLAKGETLYPPRKARAKPSASRGG